MLRVDALLAEKVPQPPDLLTQSVQLSGQGHNLWMGGSPLLLAGGLVGEQLPFPVPQRRAALS